MRAIAGFLFLSLFLTLPGRAQRPHTGSLKGIVKDAVTSQPVEAATVSVSLLTDSSLVNYTMTNKNGEFQIRDIPVAQPCRLLVSFSGLSSYTQDFIISPETRELLISTVQLKKNYEQLDDVVVAARRAPVLFKKDTIEFDAGSFKTPINGVMEDLLRLLPGLEVDENGGITYQGKRIAKITIDGKDFFGNDFKIASRNLPRDIIDKVQVIDYKTREALFNKTKTGMEDKALNIILKKDKKRGLFGRVTAGWGTGKRYESGASLNYMNGPLQLNFLGNVNNINRTNLTEGDLMTGKPDGNWRGGRGITATKGAGLNFGSSFGNGMQVNGSYFNNHSNMENEMMIRRQNFLGDTGFLYKASNKIDNSNDWHKLSLNFSYRPDSMSDLHLAAAFKGAKDIGFTRNEAISSANEGRPINQAANEFGSEAKDCEYTAELFYGHRFKKEGRAFSISMSYNLNNQPAREANKGATSFYREDGTNDQQILDQQAQIQGRHRFWGMATTYTEPLSSSMNMEFRYSYSQANKFNDRQTYRLNPLTNQHDLIDTLFSSTFRYKQSISMPAWAINYSTESLSTTIGAGIQWLEQENTTEESKNGTHQHFANLFPAARINYTFSKTGKLSLNYMGHSLQPTLEQLQSVPDNRNTLYLRLGNSQLKPSYYHDIELRYDQFNSKSFLTVGLQFNTIKNQIVDDTWFDSLQITKPMNSDGNYTVGFNSSYGFGPRHKNWSLRIAQYNNGYYSRNVSYSNQLENITMSFVINQRLALTYIYKNRITLTPSWTIRYAHTRYSLQPELDARISTHTLGGDLLVNWPSKVILEQNLQYVYNSRTATGFPSGVTRWNMAINYHMLKQGRGVIRLSVYDLLGQNKVVTWGITATYIEDVNSQVLRQYFLLSFLYSMQQMH